jgi:hypothetical protein
MNAFHRGIPPLLEQECFLGLNRFSEVRKPSGRQRQMPGVILHALAQFRCCEQNFPFGAAPERCMVL